MSKLRKTSAWLLAMGIVIVGLHGCPQGAVTPDTASVPA